MCAAVDTLKASPDFQRIARTGKKWVGAAFIMQVSKKEDGGFRLGLTVSRRVGNAVMRNRAKRRLREAVRLLLKGEPDLMPCDVVIIAKTAAVTYAFKPLCADIARGLVYAGVLPHVKNAKDA